MPKRVRDDRRTIALVAGGGAIFVLVTFLAWQSLARTNDAVEWVDHTHDVMDSLEESLEGLGRVEASRRAYSLTGDREEIARFDAAERDVRRIVQGLPGLVGDNTRESERALAFEQAVGDQLTLQRSALAEGALSTDRARALSPSMSAASVRSRGIALEMLMEERALLQTREADRERFHRSASIAMVGGATLFAGLLSLSLVRLALEVRARRRGERDEHDARERAEALVRELEAFSYAVAHDLRTPLRGIDGFSRALLEDYGDVLDAQGQEHLARVRRAAQRMSELIEDLLRLSLISREEIKLEDIDLAPIARACLAELARLHPGRTVDVEVESKLPARGDRRLVKVLLENLIGNAWKFTSKNASARIEVGAQDDRVYFVRDNGAGFDMRYAGKLFGAFQRLHDPGEFPGSGVGLATASRIVERHGGTIWAESAIDRGTTFRFTLQGAS